MSPCRGCGSTRTRRVGGRLRPGRDVGVRPGRTHGPSGGRGQPDPHRAVGTTRPPATSARADPANPAFGGVPGLFVAAASSRAARTASRRWPATVSPVTSRSRVRVGEPADPGGPVSAPPSTPAGAGRSTSPANRSPIRIARSSHRLSPSGWQLRGERSRRRCPGPDRAFAGVEPIGELVAGEGS